jgi:oligopeptidase B
MNRRKIVWFAVFGISLSAGRTGACQEPPKLDPPKATPIPKQLEKFGQNRVDNYYWLKERTDPKVIAYLDAENAYTDAMMDHTKALQKSLYDQIVGRIKQADSTAPVFDNGYHYYTQFETGKQYPILVRKKGSLEAAEEILLDENALAQGHGYFSLGASQVSPDNRLVAYGVDTGGRLFYTIRVKDLSTGKLLDDAIVDVTGNVAWANDSQTLFYTKQDPNTLRAYRVYRHRLGSPSTDDRLVYEEADETFACRIFRTKSDRYLLIGSRQTLSTEYRFLDADKPDGEFQVIQPRRPRLEYSVDHLDGHFYIRNNHDAKNFKLARAPIQSPGLDHWEEVVPHRADVFLERFELFRDFLVVEERRDGLIRLHIRPWSGTGEHQVDFGEPAYLAHIGPNHELNTDKLRFVYTSLTTPQSSYDYDMRQKSKTLVKREEVLGGFDPANYVTERLHATASDGVKVPISIVYRKGFAKDGSRPMLLYGYGSYGASMDASFQTERLSLLDRGFAYAIAHIRGGQELGRDWYENGKLLKKKNTFTDFIACAEHLIREKYARPDRLFAQGGSAGGLLMGAVINLRPDLFNGIIAQVPFVDVVTTMLDPTIPLTTFEYDEWGNPGDRTYFDYMLSYSPYDNVEAKHYPNILVTTSLQDSQVQYWEPAKWVAKLRATKTDTNCLLLRTYKEGSHGGVSGRYRRYEQTAFIYAFLLDMAGIGEKEQDSTTEKHK